eukprot:CAMPEP_0181326464 /NCGR_PEP_ID=MMETSP1101-20121128/21510_1 /TAXON_ID=46948 /ORGANISM="Rhodomonas abbreviata, Strain Caron Lab Isolate" /LENGTH=159 /DNA_ID=CAMNT_0023434915 /DNA_START=8 /DNA_END=487 /DNA_ORIENTATION=+
MAGGARDMSLVSPVAKAARARALQQKLYVTLALSCLCAALVTLLHDDSEYKELAVARQQELSDSTDSTLAKDMYGQGAGAGFNGVSHFEPVPDADTGIYASNFAGDYIGGSQDMDYSYDLSKRMFIHKGEVNTLDTDQVKANKEEADRKLDMPNIVNFP